jgi:hypothetical protein
VIAHVPFFEPQMMLDKDTHDEICVFNQLTVIASPGSYHAGTTPAGLVITFRDRNDIDSMSMQLSQ